MRYIADGKLEAYTTAQYDSPVRRTFVLLDQLFDFGFEFVGVLFP